jgi:hypothetical protein
MSQVGKLFASLKHTQSPFEDSRCAFHCCLPRIVRLIVAHEAL